MRIDITANYTAPIQTTERFNREYTAFFPMEFMFSEGRLRLMCLLFACVTLLSATGAVSSTVEAPTLQQMVDRANRIFVGEVVNRRSYWTGASIHTDVTFRTSEVLKGAESPM